MNKRYTEGPLMPHALAFSNKTAIVTYRILARAGRRRMDNSNPIGSYCLGHLHAHECAAVTAWRPVGQRTLPYSAGTSTKTPGALPVTRDIATDETAISFQRRAVSITVDQ